MGGPTDRGAPVAVPSRPVEGDRLDDEQIALVIRRASELDGQSPAGQPGLDLVLLEEAAVEAGLSRESVRRAVAELRAGALALDTGAPARRTALGPPSLTVSRCVPGPVAENSCGVASGVTTTTPSAGVSSCNERTARLMLPSR